MGCVVLLYMSDVRADEITWRAAEYQHTKKNASWYVMVGVGAGVISLVSLWRGNFFFFLFIIVAATMAIVFGRRQPRVLDFTVEEGGVRIGEDIFVRYEDVEHFSLRHREHVLDEIVLKKRTHLNPHVRIPVDTEMATRAVTLLSEHVDRVEHEDSLIDMLAEWIGF